MVKKEDDYYKSLGNDIRMYREKAGLTQADLAEAAGISRTSLTNIEYGRQRVFVDQLEMICLAIGVSTADFFQERGQPAKPKPVAKSNLKGLPMVAKFLESVRPDEEGTT
jgi:transcriptional regulator with XRE-family HTH domain